MLSILVLCFASFLMGALFGLLVQIIIYFYKRKTAEEGQFPDVNEETKMLIKEWGKVITNKYKDIEKDYNLNEEMFCNEPLLVIDYDQFGLERRKITDSHVAKTIITTPGYTDNDLISVNLRLQSNSVFIFNNSKLLDDAVSRLFQNYHNLIVRFHYPSIGRVYDIRFRMNGTFVTCERFNIFD
ncbi:uncharacterized protein OCT59_008916 [Rhizophagus irregularis]|uniref:Uncharacterized protein n=4 Tax=Rhizophagus irregularis TaxID=588596 RepID=A0A916EIW1_9GLOM|nr:hypothetical protein GLOIN_2v1496512 [Rhizophagus irregularis DAOM 181602=DAOM 197198]UZO17565.1 hypothetical protein OCT59_008916 [Rhizophagus irregularis]POG82598.1 hypothetical protein GLOIN_2v1496512 [Rhizophagus irregularis DAOM 181602=DAOM 197198]CAB4392026.1 unnamed protein product [Rhizophagus irregularis]CAB4474902.1 unnamed protein product [Rhizophagus irregularis]CAB5198513.1 unnamed protein product [Rhizophagus irregularis]|eukprot:XP_025189464.1 hypothetical protein GLOIN_2v1496512 [Rhizophagus irregularis DAOM 181602=DAOM 197198]